MAPLLLEIGCEELPAGACREAEAQLPALGERELGAAPDRLFIGPRRLALRFDDPPEQTPDEWVKGPPVDLREKAAAGFAKKSRGPCSSPWSMPPRANRSVSACGVVISSHGLNAL